VRERGRGKHSLVPHKTFLAEPWHAGDGFQRPLRSRFRARLRPSVRQDLSSDLTTTRK
jgi:hypothetical protein